MMMILRDGNEDAFKRTQSYIVKEEKDDDDEM
jgi:hypothetical protein